MLGGISDLHAVRTLLTQLRLFCHLRLVDDVPQDLLLLNQLVLLEDLLLPQVVVMLLLVLLQFIQRPLKGPEHF